MKAGRLSRVLVVATLVGQAHCGPAKSNEGTPTAASTHCNHHAQCDDHDPCTSDECFAGPGATYGDCVNTKIHSPACPAPNQCNHHAQCDDDDPCTSDECFAGPGATYGDCVNTKIESPACPGNVGSDGGTTALADPDPEDLDATNGDPSFDIVGSQSYRDGGAPWVRVHFAAPIVIDSFYSDYVCVRLRSGSTETASFTTQVHDGQLDTFTTGVAPGDVVHVVEGNEVRVLFGGASPPAADSYQIESGMLKTASSPFVQDLTAWHAFSDDEVPFPPN
jgi:hypothetical protein